MSYFGPRFPLFAVRVPSSISVHACSSFVRKLETISVVVSDELVVRAAQVVGSGTKGLPAHLRLTKERRKAHPAVAQISKEATVVEPRKQKRGSNTSKSARTICGASETSWTERKGAWGRLIRRRRRTIKCTRSTSRQASTSRNWRYSTRTSSRRAQKGRRQRNNSIKTSMKCWKIGGKQIKVCGNIGCLRQN